MGFFRIGGLIVVLGLVTLVLAPLQLLATRWNWPVAARLPFWWQRIARKLIGLRVAVEGKPAAPPLLIASNHLSWLDITLLGSVLPVSFIAKSEVAGWPVLGTLARLQRSIFIDRNRRTEAGRAAEAIAHRVGNGDIMVLFAEGTTGDGNRLLPFRSALLGAASAATGRPTITVQPVALAYVRVRGLPVGCADRPKLAWYGDMDFVSHFRRIAGFGAIDAVVSFGEPMTLGPGQDRKKVAEACRDSVKAMLDGIRLRQPSRNGQTGTIFSGRSKDAKATVGAIASAPNEAANRIS